MQISLDDLTINFSNLDLYTLLQDWWWLIGERRIPILLAATGDAFVQDEDTEQIFILDVGAGEVIPLAENEQEFRECLADKDFVTNYLGVNMIADLKQGNKNLNAGQVYSFKVPPCLGGEYTFENLEPTDISVHFSLMGQLTRKASSLASLAKIDAIRID